MPLLAVYDSDPKSSTYGTYRTSSNHLRTLARMRQVDISTKEFAEIVAVMTDLAPEVIHGLELDLIAANNCIVDYTCGDPKRIEFGPEHISSCRSSAPGGTRTPRTPIIPNWRGASVVTPTRRLHAGVHHVGRWRPWMRAALEDDPGFSEVLWRASSAPSPGRTCAGASAPFWSATRATTARARPWRAFGVFVGPAATRSVARQMKSDGDGRDPVGRIGEPSSTRMHRRGSLHQARALQGRR